jgi:hypothetical protein
MNHLISIRTNIIYAKKKKENETDKDEYKKFHELIFLVDKPTYRRTNSGDIIREREVEEFRFNISNKGFDEMIKILMKLKDIKEEELDD